MLGHANVIRIHYICGMKIRNFVPTCTNVPETTSIYTLQNKSKPSLLFKLVYQINLEMMSKQVTFGWDISERAINYKTRCIVHQQLLP